MDELIINNNEFSLIGEHEYEGKLTIWGKETLVFVDDFEGVEDLDSFVNEKINWINENKVLILDSFMIENDHYVDVVNEAIEKREFKAKSKITYKDFVDALFINNVYINLSDSSLMIDLDAEPDYLFVHLATLEIDEEYNIEFGGLNG